MVKKKKVAVKKKKVAAKKPIKKTIKKVPLKKKAAAGKPKGELIGNVTHYFPHVKAGVVKIKKGNLAIGDDIWIKGHTTDFKEKIVSLQIDRKPVTKAGKGDEVGLQVKSRVRRRDAVYKI